MVSLRRIDPASDAMVAWHEVYLAAHRADDPGEPQWLLPEMRARAAESADETSVLALACDGDTPVGAVACTLPRSDNTHVLMLDAYVTPGHRRQGIGSRLLSAAEEVAAEHARSTMLAEVLAPGPTDHDAPGDHAARRWGFQVASLDQRRTLTLPIGKRTVARVRALIGAAADPYEIVLWCGAVPARYLADRAVIQARMSTDAPLGSMDWQAETWDGARFRRYEESITAMGRRSWSAGAVERSSGRLVAATWLLGHPDHPTQVWQWDTLVLPEHRGHRLGLAIKLANLEQVQRERPSTHVVSTGNAADNAPMIAVNDALGFAVTGYWREYQRVLDRV